MRILWIGWGVIRAGDGFVSGALTFLGGQPGNNSGFLRFALSTPATSNSIRSIQRVCRLRAHCWQVMHYQCLQLSVENISALTALSRKILVLTQLRSTAKQPTECHDPATIVRPGIASPLQNGWSLLRAIARIENTALKCSSSLMIRWWLKISKTPVPAHAAASESDNIWETKKSSGIGPGYPTSRLS